MKQYGVKELSGISGISVRTLHYYDEIGLLKPAIRSESSYRFYWEAELLRLQQILFYRELGISLREIREILDDPGFDLIASLEQHREALNVKRNRLSVLLETLDNTIRHVKKERIMKKPEMLYEGLPDELGTTLRKEAMEMHGAKAVEKSEKALSALGKEGYQKLQDEFEQVQSELFKLQREIPESEKVQKVIARHYKIIRKFWGTSDLPDPQADAYAGLGQMYVADPRYTLRDGQPQPEFAEFLQKAMAYFAEGLS